MLRFRDPRSTGSLPDPTANSGNTDAVHVPMAQATPAPLRGQRGILPALWGVSDQVFRQTPGVSSPGMEMFRGLPGACWRSRLSITFHFETHFKSIANRCGSVRYIHKTILGVPFVRVDDNGVTKLIWQKQCTGGPRRGAPGLL